MSETVISVTGLGYVGLPLAAAFSKKFRTIGFDINLRRVEELKKGFDSTHEVAPEDLKHESLVLTADSLALKEANFHIVTVPTPVDDAKKPDLTPLIRASETVGKILKKGDIVVYESTVYPGATEEDCVPVLEKFSELKAGIDFKVGYSPERINPGDREHSFIRIKKVVSGQDAESLKKISAVYGAVVQAGIHEAPTIKVAEAAKVIENTQRDLNVALMNELAMIFDLMGIDTKAVLDAAGTKWNFLKFTPGLVGGHCIGVDPYYLTHKAERVGYIPQVILAGRRINDNMGKFIADKTIKEMILAGHHVAQSRVTVLGLTFKEDCPDLRNSRVVDIVQQLKSYGVEVQVYDPHVSNEDAQSEYGISITKFESLKSASAVVIAVAHKAFKELTVHDFQRMTREPTHAANAGVVVDVKSLYFEKDFVAAGLKYWRL